MRTNLPVVTAIVEPKKPGLVDTVNETKWFENHNLKRTDLNGPHNIREWGVCSQMGNIYRSGCNTNNQISRLEVFEMFPPRHLDSIDLEEKSKKKTTKGEI